MNKHKTKCPWCPKLYASAGAYSNHLSQVHGTDSIRSLSNTSKKCSLFDITISRADDSTSLEATGWDLDHMRDIMSSDFDLDLDLDYNSDPPCEGSDNEARYFTSDSECDAEGEQPDVKAQQPNTPNTHVAYGTPIAEYVLPEQEPSYNLFALFRNRIDYRLAQFFNSARTSETKVDQFFKDGILNNINPMHHIQFRSAHTIYNLVNAAASGPRWYPGTVDYPLLKGVLFHYRNIVSAVRYLLRQKAYAANMVWKAHREHNSHGDRVYSEINTGTWWEDTEVR